jgi:hypothetical protein
MSEPWEAAELLEEILRNADYSSARTRAIASILGEIEAKGPVGITTECFYFPPILKIQYRYLVRDVMKGVQGSLQEVIDLVKTGLNEGQDIFVVPSNQFESEHELVLQITSTDPAVVQRFRKKSPFANM